MDLVNVIDHAVAVLGTVEVAADHSQRLVRVSVQLDVDVITAAVRHRHAVLHQVVTPGMHPQVPVHHSLPVPVVTTLETERQLVVRDNGQGQSLQGGGTAAGQTRVH